MNTRQTLVILSKVLKEYNNELKPISQFEEDWGCKIIYRDGYITGMICNTEASATMLRLKYNAK